ncbi:MotA/TolQ/ExbB proton channel family protein [Rhodopirellula halodulae]|uniref:MotA/TolQ/ExbB proton channel family protein n=1 Tax=Rhodopirellula halodulae TaxID=2894198 RepID=UPI001E557F9B|nr:MotA/TolQ/ExbB proton channel family protein [Rhodopirellula sp. JC737]MCC9658736.1 MotA/TolQ/ExbB proton channel family protein [Rhodopirellula sp. JC737]
MMRLAELSASRSWAVLFGPATLGLVLVSVLSVGMMPTHGYAQDDAMAEFGDEAVAEEAVVDEPAGPAANEQQPVDNGGGNAGAPPAADQSLLEWVFDSLGAAYLVVFLALSITLVSLFVMNMLAARRDTLCPTELVEEFSQRLAANDNQGAYDLAKSDESVLGQVLAAGLAKVSRGYNKALEAMQEVGEEESMKLEHRLSYMALIGNLSPMIGLFGTVQGMISSFQVIATGGSTPKPSDLAAGISTALFTTLVGLAVAIPAIAAYNILRNRVARLLLEVGVESENLMSKFEDMSPKTGARG